MRTCGFAVALVLALAFGGAHGAPADEAKSIFDATGATGGVVVHLGCGDGALAAALARAGLIVHGLDADAARIAAARAHIQKLGLYGRVAVEQWAASRLPYADGLVRLVVASDLGSAPMAEVMRVLCPDGVACVKRGGAWTTTVKPWPKAIDEWTHYLHDASGNAVSKDALAGPPRRLQWVSAPLWPRSHEHTPSISAMVTAGGRIIYILDEGVRGVMDARFPERWALVARDAFSGVLLWRLPFSGWGWKEWKDPKHWDMPMSLPRRLVAVGDRVYVTLGYRAPVSVVDARTGRVLGVREQTTNTEELLWSDGLLLVRQRKEIPNYHPAASAWKVQMRRPGNGPKASPELPPASPGDETIVAVKDDTGQILWTWQEKRIVTLSLAAAGGRVCYHNFDEIVCLDLRSGKELWRAESKTWPDLTGTAGTLVMYKDMVFYAGDRGLAAWSAASGTLLWRGPRIIRTAPRHPPDLFVADGLLWGGLTAQMPTGHLPRQESPAAVKPLTGLAVQGLDPATGDVKRKVDIGRLVSPGHHVRCYRSKATERFLLWPKRGVEFVDIVGGTDHMRCDWFRGECSYGVIPSGGLIYAPPHPCLCYVGVALNGFNALAPASAGEGRVQDTDRLEKGPAYGAPGPRPSRSDASGDWPTYRHDAARSGSTRVAVPTELRQAWAVRVGGRLTSPVVAGGALLVASVDAHTVHALDASDGRARWTYTAGARMDSPPTIHDGRVLFGCRDGWVYCLRASDGALAWRFRAAPRERRIVSFEQVESPWPVPGSVLVQGGVAYVAAGRSSYLDGGLFLYGLDPKTGKVLHQARLDGPWPDVTRDVGRPYDMDGAKSDILTSDGTSIFLFYNALDLALHRRATPPPGARGQRKVDLRLMALSGFRDDTWHDRMFWIYGREWPGRYWATSVPAAGQILVFDETAAYALKAFAERGGMSLKFVPGRAGYTLRADDTRSDLIPQPNANASPEARRRLCRRRRGAHRARPPKWLVKIPVRARAMVLAGETLFLAGPPDAAAEPPSQFAETANCHPRLWRGVVPDAGSPPSGGEPAARDGPHAVMPPTGKRGGFAAAAAFDGRAAAEPPPRLWRGLGSELWAVSAADGQKLAEQKLDAVPVFDGLIASAGGSPPPGEEPRPDAGGRLYLSTRDGQVICFAGKP